MNVDLLVDLLKLVNVTVKLIEKNPKINLDDEPIATNCNENIWNKICLETYGNIEKETAYSLRRKWKRNDHNYATMVQCMVENVRKKDKFVIDQKANFNFQLSLKEVNEHRINYDDRSKLSSDFDEIISAKLREKGIKCWFICSYNWFKKENSRKQQAVFWRGSYKCIDSNCQNACEAFICDGNGPLLLINIKYNKISDHLENVVKKVSCRGNARSIQAKHLVIEGTSNVQSKNYLNNQINLDSKLVTKHATLRKIKQEYLTRNRISNDVFVDAQATKLLMDNLLCSASKSNLKGFVQEIGLHPYGFLLLSAHDQTTIAKHLSSIRSKMEQNNIKLPSVIVTDQSWALINSVMHSFNNCKIQNYLDWCFIMLLNKDQNLMKVRLLLCSVHFLKNVIKKSKSVSCQDHVRKMFINFFTLLQNSTNLDQFNFYLGHLFNVFNNKIADGSVFHSLQVLSNELKTRNLNTYEQNETADTRDQNSRNESFENFLKESKIFISEDFEEKVQKNSPFSNYFDEEIKRYGVINSENEQINANKNFMANEFYCTKLFQIIQDHLHLVPLWTGIMIDQTAISYDIKTRLSNNPVENWFSQVKNYLITKQRVLISEYVSLIYKRLLAKFLEFYKDQNDPSDYFSFFFKDQVEMWQDKNARKNKRFKGAYYDNKDIFNLKTFYNYGFLKSMQREDFVDLFKNINNSETSETKMDYEIFNNLLLNEISPDQPLFNENILDDQFCMNFMEKDFILHIQEQSFEVIRSNFVIQRSVFTKLVKALRNIENYWRFNGTDTVYDNYNFILGIEDHFFPVYCTGDGNCLYNSISKILFGNESKNILIKLCSIFILFEYEEFFQNFSKNQNYDNTLNQFITFSCRKNEFSTERNVLAISLLLDRTIYSYNETLKLNQPCRFKYCLSRSSTYEPILIGYYKIHFFPILLGENIKKNEINFQDSCQNNDMTANFEKFDVLTYDEE